MMPLTLRPNIFRKLSILTPLVITVLFTSGLSIAQEFSTQKHQITVDTIVKDLDEPWGLAFLPGGAMLVTEKPGALRIVQDGKISAAIPGVPKVDDGGQGGLLGIALDVDFNRNQLIYLSFSEPDDRGRNAGTSIARARLVLEPSPRLEDVRVIFRQNKKTSSGRHFGSRIVPMADGSLFFTIGDRGDSERAQDPFDHAGSVLRIMRDGNIPKDNPFADGKKAAPEIWSTGHRNPQGATLNRQTGKIWTVEHGARGGDEINMPEAGKNYGWPIISYGRHYFGGKIGEGTKKAGLEQPLWYWVPSIAPSNLTYYDGAAFPNWQGNLFAGALAGEMLVRLEIKDGKVTSEERLLQEKFGRIRDVQQGPEGFLYLLTDDGELLRVRPS